MYLKYQQLILNNLSFIYTYEVKSKQCLQNKIFFWNDNENDYIVQKQKEFIFHKL